MLPQEVELIIYKYLHELNMLELRKELMRNIKGSFVYKLKWKGSMGNIEYDEEYDKIILDKNISGLYFKNKLHNSLNFYYYYSYE